MLCNISLTNLEVITMLDETLLLFEKRENSIKDQMKSASTQTEIMRCQESEFPAECVTNLVDNMREIIVEISWKLKVA